MGKLYPKRASTEKNRTAYSASTPRNWKIKAFLLNELFCFFQLVTEDATWGKKLKGYLASEWNIIDVIYLSMIFVAYSLSRFGGSREVARILYGMVTLLLWLRVIRLYQVRSQLMKWLLHNSVVDYAIVDKASFAASKLAITFLYDMSVVILEVHFSIYLFLCQIVNQ